MTLLATTVVMWVLDLDGVVWRAAEPISGSAAAIARLQAANETVLFVTNNASMTADGYVAKLASHGVVAEVSDVVHGGHAVGEIVTDGERVLLCAGVGVAEALHGRAEIIDIADVRGPTPRVDTVVVGLRSDFAFSFLHCAVQAVLDGARLVAPSADPLYPVANGFHMGGGSIAASVGFATGAEVVTAGKPEQPIATVVATRSTDRPLRWVVGDQAATDGWLARRLNVPFALVASGVPMTKSADVPVAHRAEDLASVVDDVFAGRVK